jgi:hypothetical protein
VAELMQGGVALAAMAVQRDQMLSIVIMRMQKGVILLILMDMVLQT